MSNTCRGMERNEKKIETTDNEVEKEEKEEEDEEEEVDEVEVEMDRLMALEYHQRAQVASSNISSHSCCC